MVICSREIMLPVVKCSKNTNICFEPESESPCNHKSHVERGTLSIHRHPELPNRVGAKKIFEPLAFGDV